MGLEHKKSASIEHPLFDLLRSEHQEILLLLKGLDSCIQVGEFKKITDTLWFTAEQKHHYKEEILLFEKIYKNPKITEGGPMCSLFFDFHMMQKAKDKVEAITKHPLTVEVHQAEIISSNCPLTIPLEEHRGGKDLLSYIRCNLEKLEISVVKKYLNLYREIQLEHIKKEENCLFHMCASLLTTIECDEILKQWKRV